MGCCFIVIACLLVIFCKSQAIFPNFKTYNTKLYNMAAGDFSLPIGHLTLGISNLNFCLGREYLQPVDIPLFNNTHTKGLECWLKNNSPNNNLYAILNGTLSYNPLDRKLILIPSDTVRMNQIRGMLEPTPDKIFYSFPEANDVSQAIIDLLTTEFNKTSSIHPILDNVFRNTNQTLRVYLNQQNNLGNLAIAISYIGASFAAGAFPISVIAGDVIGKAGNPTAGLLLPSGCQLSQFGDNKYLLLEIFDYAGFHMNPTYYLWRFLRDEHTATNPKMQLITNAPIRANNTFNHPFLDALNVNLNIELKPRAIINTTLPGQTIAQDVLLFPLENLADWRGARIGTANESREISLIQWRITNNNDLDLEIQRKTGKNSHDYKLCGETFSGGVNICPNVSNTTNNLIQQIWDDWGNDINDICRILQWPSELVVATIGHETLRNGNVHHRAIRLEPINQTIKQRLINSGISSNVAQNYLDLTTTGFGWTKWDAGDPNTWVLTNNFSTNPVITYGQLLDIADVIPHLISPGLMQTLVDKVGIHINNWLIRDLNYNNVQTVFNVDPIPAGYRNHLQWMLNGRHSILLGTVMHKWAYLKRANRMSIFEVGAAHNHGRLELLPNLSGILNPYQLYYNGINYPIEISENYNAIQHLFTSGENGINKYFKSY